MEVKEQLGRAKRKFQKILGNAVFVAHPGTSKREIRFSRLKWIAVFSLVVFVFTVLFMPSEDDHQFSKKISVAESQSNEVSSNDGQRPQEQTSEANSLWESPGSNMPSRLGTQVNYNTSMIVGQKGGNAKTEIHAGQRLPIRIVDKFIVSQDQVPIMAELILDSMSDSGLKLPAGTRFYGEASFQKGSERANIQFSQISLPSGQIIRISGVAVGKDGQSGISGHVFSDAAKNTAGQLLTTFVGGLASGSMQTDILGHSQGGLKNGLLNAVSQTAQTRAQMYGEKLQAEREWIEVSAGTEADAVLSDPLNLQEGGAQ